MWTLAGQCSLLAVGQRLQFLYFMDFSIGLLTKWQFAFPRSKSRERERERLSKQERVSQSENEAGK
jgi:hypothetical protein